MGVKDATPCTAPGTKSKAITKKAHQDMLARRLGGEAGEDNAINHLKAQIGKLNSEIAHLTAKLNGADPSKLISKTDPMGRLEKSTYNGAKVENKGESAQLPESNGPS